MSSSDEGDNHKQSNIAGLPKARAEEQMRLDPHLAQYAALEERTLAEQLNDDAIAAAVLDAANRSDKPKSADSDEEQKDADGAAHPARCLLHVNLSDGCNECKAYDDAPRSSSPPQQANRQLQRTTAVDLSGAAGSNITAGCIVSAQTDRAPGVSWPAELNLPTLMETSAPSSTSASSSKYAATDALFAGMSADSADVSMTAHCDAAEEWLQWSDVPSVLPGVNAEIRARMGSSSLHLPGPIFACSTFRPVQELINRAWSEGVSCLKFGVLYRSKHSVHTVPFCVQLRTRKDRQGDTLTDVSEVHLFHIDSLAHRDDNGIGELLREFVCYEDQYAYSLALKDEDGSISERYQRQHAPRGCNIFSIVDLRSMLLIDFLSFAHDSAHSRPVVDVPRLFTLTELPSSFLLLQQSVRGSHLVQTLGSASSEVLEFFGGIPLEAFTQLALPRHVAKFATRTSEHALDFGSHLVISAFNLFSPSEYARTYHHTYVASNAALTASFREVFVSGGQQVRNYTLQVYNAYFQQLRTSGLISTQAIAASAADMSIASVASKSSESTQLVALQADRKLDEVNEALVKNMQQLGEEQAAQPAAIEKERETWAFALGIVAFIIWLVAAMRHQEQQSLRWNPQMLRRSSEAAEDDDEEFTALFSPAAPPPSKEAKG